MAVGCVVWWLAAFGCWRRRTVGVVAMVAQRRNGGVLGVNSILSVHFFALPSKAHQPVSGLAHVAFVQHSDVVQVRESTKFTARARPSRLIDQFANPRAHHPFGRSLGFHKPTTQVSRPREPHQSSPARVWPNICISPKFISRSIPVVQPRPFRVPIWWLGMLLITVLEIVCSI